MTYEEYQKKEAARVKIAVEWMEKGVEIEDLYSVFIDRSVVLEPGVYLGPCVTLSGETRVGAGTKIYQNSRLVDAVVGEDVEIQSSVILESSIGDRSKIGPFAYLRPNSRVGADCKVGDFVEVKNSTIGDGSKSSHLTYIGDADVGSGVNLGCGVVFVNYDGREKHRTTVGDHVFVGCNANLISPVSVGDGSYIAAGSTITDDVPEDALAIARERQTNKEGWAARKGLFRKK